MYYCCIWLGLYICVGGYPLMMPWHMHAGAISGRGIVEPYKHNMHFVLHDTINLPQLFNNFGIEASNINL